MTTLLEYIDLLHDAWEPSCCMKKIVAVFWKTNLMDLESIFYVDESHTHMLSRDTKCLRLDGRVYFYNSDTVRILMLLRAFFTY